MIYPKTAIGIRGLARAAGVTPKDCRNLLATFAYEDAVIDEYLPDCFANERDHDYRFMIATNLQLANSEAI